MISSSSESIGVFSRDCTLIECVPRRADVVSNRQLYRVKSQPLKRVSSSLWPLIFTFIDDVQRLSSGVIPYAADQSINIDYCGESQGCLIVPHQCNNDAKCEYTLSWQVIDNDTAQFHIIARAQGFVGVGLSNDEKRVWPVTPSMGSGLVHINAHLSFRAMIKWFSAQEILKDMSFFITCLSVFKHRNTSSENDPHTAYARPMVIRMRHISVVNLFDVSPPMPMISAARTPDNAMATSEAESLIYVSHTTCIRSIRTTNYEQAKVWTRRQSISKWVNLLGLRIPLQDITIVNNRPINFERRIWPKSHPHAASVLAKIHGKITGIKICVHNLSSSSYIEYHCLGSSGLSWCDGRPLLRFDSTSERTTNRCRR